jgi:HD-like signal output (HDOD) protein
MSCLVETRVDWSALREKLLGTPGTASAPPWVKLPSPPVTLLRCVQKAQQPNVAPADLARIIETDAGLTCQILRRVNAASEGVSSAIKSIDEAMARLGVRRSVMYLITEAMKQSLRSGMSKVLNLNNFAASNLERALFARRVARYLGTDEELAFAAALIADCLLPVVTNQASRTYLRFLDDRSQAALSLIDFEKREFGWTHPYTTAAIFSGWGFPDDLVCTVALHHSSSSVMENAVLQRTAGAAAAIASLIPDQLNQEPDGIRRLLELPKRLPGIDVLTIAAEIDEEFREISPELQNPFPLIRRMTAKRR